jgi:hypothetical protein
MLVQMAIRSRLCVARGEDKDIGLSDEVVRSLTDDKLGLAAFILGFARIRRWI